VAIHHRGPEGAEALTSPSFDEPRREIANRRTKDRFHRQPVKIVGFRGPGRLPPASSPPQALPPPLVSESRALDVISPPSDSSPWARPPSPTPAATEVASLSQTPLADFCNQKQSPSTPLKRLVLTRGALSRASVPPEVALLRPRAARAQDRSLRVRCPQGALLVLAENPRASIHAAVQRPTRRYPSTSSSPRPSRQAWKAHWAGDTAQARRLTRRANGQGRLENRGAFH
jgi:hypothetical protein